MKQTSAKPAAKAVAARQPRARGRTEAQPATAPPNAGSRSSRARLTAEVARLQAELEASRARISELETRIEVDPLTETLNRRGFDRELKRSLAYVKRYGASAALIYLDLDGFKPVNDGHGHAAGDAVLKAVAATLVRNVRASDLVGRIGGDEFVILLWNIDEAAAATKAADLEAAIYATRVRFRSSTLVVGASAGAIAIGPLDTPAQARARADAAMYARKLEKHTSPRVREEVGLRKQSG